jgi:hypothetical protein
LGWAHPSSFSLGLQSITFFFRSFSAVTWKNSSPSFDNPPSPPSYFTINTMADWEEKEIAWEKPAWAKNGPALRKTGANAATGKLEKPITSLPHQKDDGPFAKPEWTADVSTIEKPAGNLAKPITSATSDPTKWEKPDWTKKPVLKGTGKGDKLRTGGDIARPIGGIKPVDDE